MDVLFLGNRDSETTVRFLTGGDSRMKRISFLPLGLLFASTAFAQSNSTDSDTLKALLAEVRLLRHDLQTTTVAAQKAQILVYRAQAQESVVRRVQERVDDTRSKLTQIQSEQRNRAASIKQIEERKSRSETSATQQKELEDLLPQIKARFDADANKEQETQARLIEAEEQLRLEQAKLGALQDQLDRLEKTLEPSQPR
jgi:chromosome segregation ATPase